MDKICTNCIFCRQEDIGYSNYTVVDTEIHCMFGKFEPYKAWSNIKVNQINKQWAEKAAANCKAFKEGTGLYIDCDHVEEDKNIEHWIAQYIKPQANG